ncbi:unnamed protein product [Amoebophrya sp. A120]|nr:unnamed protein product [Amoebophrya sp. A120]|eukprot:GSA120T00015019001.1
MSEQHQPLPTLEEAQRAAVADLFGDDFPETPKEDKVVVGQGPSSSSSIPKRETSRSRSRSPRREGPLKLAADQATPSFDGSLAVPAQHQQGGASPQRSAPASPKLSSGAASPKAVLSSKRPSVSGSSPKLPFGQVENSEQLNEEIRDVGGSESVKPNMEANEESKPAEIVPVPVVEEVEPPHKYCCFNSLEDGGEVKKLIFKYRRKDGWPLWQVDATAPINVPQDSGRFHLPVWVVGTDAEGNEEIKVHETLHISCSTELQESLMKELENFENPPSHLCAKVMLYDKETEEQVGLTVPDPEEIYTAIERQDRSYGWIEHMLEKDKEILSNRCKMLMREDIKEWLLELLKDGTKQNILMTSSAKDKACFKKRFFLDMPEGHKRLPRGMKFPSCPKFMEQEVTKCFAEQPVAIQNFLVEFGTGSPKSFVVIINKEAWQRYVSHCGLDQKVELVRVEATVKRICDELTKSTYDAPLAHWKQALGYLRKLDDLDFTLETFKKCKVAPLLHRYRKHEDRQVVQKATDLLKKYKKHAEELLKSSAVEDSANLVEAVGDRDMVDDDDDLF